MQSQKQQNYLCLFPRQTIQYHIIQVYAPTTNAKEADTERFYDDLQDLLGLKLKEKKESFSSQGTGMQK